ncbi:MAG: hypothetical protein L6R39_001903 [Caloplaca ligustica]|nr:MAG: hypothetical protein L6R39_001903 [Caloplaca ligustica]
MSNLSFSPLASSPGEIQYAIFIFLPKSSLKCLRLVCKQYLDLITPLLLQRAYISRHAKDTEVFKNITSHPFFKTTVRHIIYDTAYFTPLHLEQEYYERLRERFAVGLPMRTLIYADEEAQLMRDELSRPQLHDPRRFKYHSMFEPGFTGYCETAREQAEPISQHWFEEVSKGLRCLERVDTVEVRNAWYMGGAEGTTHRNADGTRQEGSPLARQWPLTSLEPFGDGYDYSLPQSGEFVGFGLHVVMELIHSGRQQPRSLKVVRRGHEQACYGGKLRLGSLDAILRPLVSLDLDWADLTYNFPPDAIRVFLDKTVVLETLRLALPKARFQEYDLDEVFPLEKVWGSLRSLSLANLTASAYGFQGLLSRTPQLVVFDPASMIIVVGSAAEVIEALRSRGMKRKLAGREVEW